jgi:hypothetical protein
VVCHVKRRKLEDTFNQHGGGGSGKGNGNKNSSLLLGQQTKSEQEFSADESRSTVGSIGRVGCGQPVVKGMGITSGTDKLSSLCSSPQT